MSIVWQSSWFWLMICSLLLLLAGCTLITVRPSFRETQVPLVSLTPSPIPTFLPLDFTQVPFFPPDNNRPVWTTSRGSPPPGYQRTPSCYRIAGGNVSCLGQIWNNSTEILGDTSIKLDFFDTNGQNIGEQIITAEQRIIPEGEFASYRAVVSGDLAKAIDDNTVIQSTIYRTLPPVPEIRQLHISASRGSIVANGRYDLSVTIQNNSEYPVNNIRLFATLDSNRWGIVGYSVFEVEDILSSGAEHNLQVEIIPHTLPDEIWHILHIEATTGQ